MITEIQKDILSMHGYRVVFSPRGEHANSCAVEYPNKRPDAYMGIYSREVFENQDLACEHAWQDYNAGNFSIGR